MAQLRIIVALGVAWGLTLSASLAHADDAACIDANAEAQKLERAGKLRDAHAKLVACASDECPAAVRADCASILARVEAAQPTFAIDVRDESGATTTHARITIDGEPSPDASIGRAVAVDPGAHTVVAELGALRRETRAVVVEADKGKLVTIDFTRPRDAARFSVPWLAWTFGALAVAAGGAGVAFGVHGSDDKSRLDASCRATHTCTAADYHEMATSFDAANVLFGVAAGAVLAAVITTLVWPRSKRASLTLSASLVHVRF